jgi:hypothetical protein
MQPSMEQNVRCVPVSIKTSACWNSALRDALRDNDGAYGEMVQAVATRATLKVAQERSQIG